MPLGGSQSEASAISPSGQYIAGLGAGAFLLHAGQVTAIPNADAVNSVNDSGEVVGTYPANGFNAAFVWDPTQGPRNLNDLIDPAARASWRLDDATGINDRGQIVGQGAYNGTPTAYLLTPIPEPVGGALAATAMLAILLRPRRQDH